MSMETERLNGLAEKLRKSARKRSDDDDAKEDKPPSLAALADQLIAQILVWKLEYCPDDDEPAAADEEEE